MGIGFHRKDQNAKANLDKISIENLFSIQIFSEIYRNGKAIKIFILIGLIKFNEHKFKAEQEI